MTMIYGPFKSFMEKKEDLGVQFQLIKQQEESQWLHVQELHDQLLEHDQLQQNIPSPTSATQATMQLESLEMN